MLYVYEIQIKQAPRGVSVEWKQEQNEIFATCSKLFTSQDDLTDHVMGLVSNFRDTTGLRVPVEDLLHA